MNLYSHVMPELNRDAAERIDAILAPKVQKSVVG